MIFTRIWLIKIHYPKSITNYSKNWNSLRNLHTTRSHFQSANFYETLGVKKDATQREIKSAYFQLSKKYHPDVAGNSANAATKFLEITEAYDCLRDPERRRAYDNQMSGRGGRYPGDNSDPFQFRQRQGFQYQSGNPFHNKQFSQEEFERIWNEFNRMRNQRETYDQRMEYEKQRLWMEYAKRRAERWQAFHQRYPDGPPGSFKWEFRFGPNAGNQQRRVYQGWELVRRIALVYFLCFMIVSFFQVFYHAFSTETPRRDARSREETPDKDKIDTMMTRQPSSPSSFMYSQPDVVRPRNPTNIYVPSDSVMSYHPSGKEVTYSDETGSQFSSYVSSDK